MSQTMRIPPPGFDDLTVEEQIDYISSLWDRIAAHPEKVPVPHWHKELLSERLATDSICQTWDEVEEELLKELRNPG